MRKFGAFSAVAAAAVVMAPAALAATAHQTVNSHHLNNHHFLVVRQLPRTSMKAETTLSGAQEAMHPQLAFAAPSPPVPSSAPLPTPSSGTTNSRDTLLVALVQADGPKSGGQSVTVSGGGLTWTRDASQIRASATPRLGRRPSRAHPQGRRSPPPPGAEALT